MPFLLRIFRSLHALLELFSLTYLLTNMTKSFEDPSYFTNSSNNLLYTSKHTILPSDLYLFLFSVVFMSTTPFSGWMYLRVFKESFHLGAQTFARKVFRQIMMCYYVLNFDDSVFNNLSKCIELWNITFNANTNFYEVFVGEKFNK